ncbi:hypothetical protein [Saccharicrinis sp. FJH54]|uniref:hypothetical protein n=1 Tax=Saccharicrinis sp. FJH54 TaxID=3344665 RepID=UPI0035D4A471
MKKGDVVTGKCHAICVSLDKEDVGTFGFAVGRPPLLTKEVALSKTKPEDFAQQNLKLLLIIPVINLSYYSIYFWPSVFLFCQWFSGGL